MENKTLLIVLGVLGGLAVVVCGCGAIGVGLLVPAVQKVREAADRAEKMNDLKMVGLAAHSYYEANKKMPANIQDMRPFLAGAPVDSRIQRNEIEVIWNVLPLSEFKEGTSHFVYGWEVKPHANNVVLVLMLDGSVRTMTDDEFRRAAKAKTTKDKDK